MKTCDEERRKKGGGEEEEEIVVMYCLKYRSTAIPFFCLTYKVRILVHIHLSSYRSIFTEPLTPSIT
jgi:hypothetical protein